MDSLTSVGHGVGGEAELFQDAQGQGENAQQQLLVPHRLGPIARKAESGKRLRVAPGTQEDEHHHTCGLQFLVCLYGAPQGFTVHAGHLYVDHRQAEGVVFRGRKEVIEAPPRFLWLSFIRFLLPKTEHTLFGGPQII